MFDGSETNMRVCDIVQEVACKHGIIQYIGPQERLVDGGITSLALVDLILALESRFDLFIPDHDMTPAAFECIDSIAKMIARLLTADGKHSAAVVSAHIFGGTDILTTNSNEPFALCEPS